MEVGNIIKAATFKSFLYLSYKKRTISFFVTVLFHIFKRQTLTDDFWGLHKNMSCEFPLTCILMKKQISIFIIFGINKYIYRNGYLRGC